MIISIVVGTDSNRITNVDIVGCQRRSAYDFQKELRKKVDFICDGEEGPPCTVMIGKEANFTATLTAGGEFKYI